MLLLALAAVGRGGQGDVGQRIRDEILYVQSRNNAKVANFDYWFVDVAQDPQLSAQTFSIATWCFVLSMAIPSGTSSERHQRIPEEM